MCYFYPSSFSIDMNQIVSVSNTEPTQTLWFLEPNWIAVWLGIILVILGIVQLFQRMRRKGEVRKLPEFPFEIIEPKDLATRLNELQLLTETRNKYFSRRRIIIHTPEKRQDSRRRILIFGRASIGKTREALELITNELLTGSDPGAVLIPAKAATIPEDFSYEQIPPALVNKAVVLLYDDLPNIYPSTAEKKEAKLTTPQERLQKMIECWEEKTNQFHFVATARNELRDKLGIFDYKNDPFWSTFQVFEVSELEKEPEIEMIKDLVKLYDIIIDDKAIQRIREINEGYSCESIVTFLKNRTQAKISIEKINRNFKKEAFESWRKSTFEVLHRQKPEIEEIYKVFKFLRFQLNSITLKSTVLVLSENLLKKRMKGIFKFARNKALKTLKFLEKRHSISVSEDIILIPDYHLEQFSDLDIEEQISILIRKVKKLSDRERKAIADSLLSLGFSGILEGAFENSLEKFGQALIFNPQSAGAFNNRGIVYDNKGKFDEAIEDYNEAIKLNPQNVGAFNNRGIAYANKGKLDKAIENYNEAIRLDPKYAHAFNNLGLAYANKEKFDEAIKNYNEAIRLGPKYAVAFNNRGLAYTNKGEFDKAIEDYNEAIKLNPQNVGAFNNRGIAYLSKGEFDKAIGDFNKAIKLNPQYATAMANKGKYYEIQKNKEKAKYWYKQALKYKDQLPDKGKRVLQWLKELEEK